MNIARKSNIYRQNLGILSYSWLTKISGINYDIKKARCKLLGVGKLSDSQSTLERAFAQEWLILYPDIDLYSEYRFDKKRRYRWDFCHPESMVAIEIQGGVWMQKSGHSGGTGAI